MPLKALDRVRTERARFGSALQSARTAKQWSQEHLGAEVGVSQAAVASWESGVNAPREETVFRLEARLGVRAGQLSQHLGFLPLGAARPNKVGVVEAILVDTRLTQENRRVLLAAYNAMVAQ